MTDAAEPGQISPRAPITIVVLGAGCSGVLTAANLLRHPHARPRAVILVDRSPRLGRGAAFGTTDPQHLLNVPAGQMSAYPDAADHFLDWARGRDGSVTAASFLPRSVYGEYLADVLVEAVAAAAPRVTFRTVIDEVVGVVPNGPRGADVQLAGQGCLPADAVVLALGNLPPTNPAIRDREFYADARYVRDPWSRGALDAVGRDDDVLLIGSGLTAVDVALTLHARDHRGLISAVSRRGLVPIGHLDPPLPPSTSLDVDRLARAKTVSTLMGALRDEVRAAEHRGEDWRQVIDAMRPHTVALWRGLDRAEQARFLRHAARYWEVRRHRMAPEVARRIAEQLGSGRLQVIAGSVDAYRADRDGVETRINRRRGGTAVLRVGAVVNCTGPSADVARAGVPVLDSLLDAGAVTPGPFGLGLAGDEYGALLDSRGIAAGALWSLGGFRRGDEWETTAVGEIRAQAQALAGTLLDVGSE